MLSTIKPLRKDRVLDLAREAGFDVSDWENFSGKNGPSTNPKYCYEWSYIEPGKVVILNLWHGDMHEENGRIVHRGNFRENAENYRSLGQRSQWVTRARKLDTAVKTALDDNLPIRVIVLDGIPKVASDDAVSSTVMRRELDPELWSIASYDRTTGDFELERGVLDHPIVDQFDIDLAEKGTPIKQNVLSSVYQRDPAVRRLVLNRSKGRCELCGQLGFKMPNGSLYLETHHIVPLSQKGHDHPSNMAAICANDHRRAHYSEERDEIARKLTVIAKA